MRGAEVAAVLWYLVWIASMIGMALRLTTWPFRVGAAGAAVFVCYRFWRFLAGLRGADVPPSHAA